ncbi:MAG: TonB-dependent receptor [Blastocatellia bacterium]|nr:TonB-dependent receptor [Blastocatellia bacterium]
MFYLATFAAIKRMTTWGTQAALALLLGFVMTVTSGAQTARGRLVGTITDTQGAVLGGVTITATNLQTNLVRTITTNESGDFTIVELPPGTYKIETEAQGFKRGTLTVEINIARDTQANLTLEPGAVGEIVTVQGGTPLVNTTTTENGGTLDNKQLLELPLNGRDFQDLLSLRPGFQRRPGGGFGTTNVNGQRNTSNNYQIDGISNNDNYSGTVAQGQEGVNIKTGGFLPVDAVQEFTTSSNPGAQYGNKAGGVVNVALKSGTNEFHGSLYEFFRNDKLDARAFFNTANQPKNPLRMNQFGFTFGGPIVKDKLFFFGNYEGQRVRQSESYMVNSPGAAAISAAAPKQGGINPLSAKILSLFPAGNSRNQATVNIPTFSDIDNYIIKLDYTINSRNTLNGRYILGNTNQTELDNFYLRPEYVSGNNQRSQLAGVSYTTVLKPTLVNEFRFGYTRLFQVIAPIDRDVNPADFGLNTGVTDPTRFGFPRIRITGFDILGGRSTNLTSDPSETYSFIDNVSWTKGRHNLKFGGEYRFDRAVNTRDQAARGEFRFRSLADFLAGKVDRGAVLTGSTLREVSQKSFGLFVQDEFKIHPHVTLNYGVRYEFFGVINEANNLLANFYPDRGLVQVGTGVEKPYNRDNNNFAPRVGLAWDVNGKGRTVIRASWGLFYDPPALSAFIGQNGNLNAITPTLGLNFNPTGNVKSYVIRPRGSAIKWQSGTPLFTSFAIPTSFLDVLGIDENIRTPYSQNYSLNVQQQLWKNGVLEVGYVGSHGTKLYQLQDINQVFDPKNEIRPFDNKFVNKAGDPLYQYVNFLTSAGNSNYNSLQVTFTQRNTRGFSTLVGYTFGKSLDAASSNRPVNPQNSRNLAAERARSDFDVRHRLTGSISYEIPNLKFLPKVLGTGWAVNTIMNFQTGRPVDIFYGDDVSGFLEFNDRPNVIGDLSLIKFRPGQPLDKSILNRVFAEPKFGTFGNAGRNLLTAPGFSIVDFSVTKNTQLTERMRLQFRTEFFNIANHPQFAQPRGDLFGSSFGSLGDTADRGNPLASGGPRRIQFALKLTF